MKTLLVFASAASLLAQETGGFNRLRIIPSPDNTKVGEIDLLAPNGKHSIGIAAPDVVSSSLVYKLPPTDPGGCLQTDGTASHQISMGVCGGPNAVSVDATHPIYLYSHFFDNNAKTIALSFSNDGLNFKPIRKGGSMSTIESRDPSVRVLSDASSPTGYHFYFVTSPTAAQPNKVQIYESYDLITITGPTLLDMTTVVAGATNIFAPEWITADAQAASGTPFGFEAHISTDNTATFTPYYITYNVTTHAFSGTTVSISSTAQGTTFDPYTFYDRDVLAADGTTIRTGSHKYYKLYVDERVPTSCETGAGGRCFYQGISYAVATSFLGPYTTVTPVKNSTNSHNGTGGGGPYGNWDVFGFSATSEAPSVYALPNGCVRIVADTWVDLFAARDNLNNPRHYLVQYRDSCPANGADPFSNLLSFTNGPVAPINIAQAEHGTILPITDPKIGNLIYQAAEHFRNENGLQGHTVFGNTAVTAFYPMTLSYDSANGFIQNNQPPEFAIGGADAGDATGNSYASLGACGLVADSCTAPIGGKRRLIEHFQLSAGWQHAFNNTNIDTGESTLLLGNGIFNYASSKPGSASSYGARSLWEITTNNQYLGPIASGGNVANHWFGIYNFGLGGFGTVGNLMTNGGFEAGTMATWLTTGGTSAAQTTTVRTGTYAAAVTGATQLVNSVNGLTPQQIYTLTAWCRADVASGGTCRLQTYDPGSTPVVETTPITTADTVWHMFSLSHVADSSGTIGFKLISTGNVFWDDVSIADYGARTGGFPLAIDPTTGGVRANWGMKLGQGDSTSLLTRSNINMDSPLPNVLNIGDGEFGHHNGIVEAGVIDVTAAYRVNGADVLTGGENRTLRVQRVEPGFTGPGFTGPSTLPASAAATIFSVTGAGNIADVQIAMIGASSTTMLNSRLRLTVDGAVVMNVDLGTFFLTHGSAGGGTYSTKYAELFGNERRAFTHWGSDDSFGAHRKIFIPYTTSCLLEIVNADTSTPALFTQVQYYAGAPSTATYGVNRKVFHAVVTEISTVASQYASVDLLPTVTLGTGVVGQLESVDQVMFQAIASPIQQPTWLEGDPTITVDGSISHQTGGTEDFFGCQFYCDQLTTRTSERGFAHIGPSQGVVLTSAYRYFADPVVFSTSLKYSWYNGQAFEGVTPPGAVNVGALVIYYTSQ